MAGVPCSSGSLHLLDPLLRPRSIAFMGASPRPDTPGNTMLHAAARDGYAGRLYAVNPRHSSIGPMPCFPDLDSLPETVGHVVLGLGNAQLEDGLRAAVRYGARAVTIFASCNLTGEPHDGLAERLGQIAQAAGIVICGGNGMGFCNPCIGLRVSGFAAALSLRPGGVAFITQSGSAFSALAYSDARLKFSVCISSGREITTCAADYMDWALDQPETKVIGLFLETARAPDRFRAALDKAARSGVPVVVLKVGRSALGASLAVSHSGAVAGDRAAWEALFSGYGVVAVDTLDQLAANLLLFSAVPDLPPGGLASLHDSGGEREMVADLAERIGVPFAAISPQTHAALALHLDAGLQPASPLDVWGTGRDFEMHVKACMAAMLADPATAIGVLFQDVRDGSYIAEGFADAVIGARMMQEKPPHKPVVIVSNYASVAHRALALRATEAGVPVIDGTTEGLEAIANLMAFRDRRLAPGAAPTPVDGAIRRRWRKRLAGPLPLTEAESLLLLADYGIRTARPLPARAIAGALEAAQEVGFPVVLKTAAPGILHKSDVGGVIPGLTDGAALIAAYAEMAARLGPRVTVAPMVKGRVEVAFGMVNDPQFGPWVMVAAGGIYIEALQDWAVTMPPLTVQQAGGMIGKLRISRLMGSVRGLPAVDTDAVAEALTRFALLVADLGELIAEMDVNPLLVSEHGCVAVDALVVTMAQRKLEGHRRS